MTNRERGRWITQTAVFLALLVVAQWATAPLGNPLVTGSLVNLMLILSVMTGGLPSGVVVAVLSPVLAKLLGIGPLWSLIPFIVAGNLVLVVVWHVVGNLRLRVGVAYGLALVSAAVAKFLVLYLGIVQLAVPLLLQLPEKQAAVVSATFSVSQLFTALAGGALALLVLPVLKKALRLQRIKG